MKIVRLLLIAALSLQVFAQSAPPPTTPETLQSIKTLMDQMVAQGVFRGNMLVAQNGNVLLNQSYGMANFEWQKANTPNARFRVGSLTKTMTAMLVLDLAQDKKLNLDDTIIEHLPYYRKDTGSVITIAQLLDHSSGLPSFTSLPDFNHSISRIKLPTTTFVKRYCQPDLLTPPGTTFYYSNTGFFILGAIVESVTAQSYAQALQERVLTPLGMTNTAYGQNSDILPEFAYPYMMEGCVNAVAPFTEMSVPFSAGGVYSTVEDLNKFNNGISANTVLNPRFTKLMLTPHISEGHGAGSAYGWDVVPLPIPGGKPVVVHAKVGQIWGYSNFMIRTPDFFVALLGNMTEANSGNIAAAIVQILYGADPAVVTPSTPAPVAIAQQICKMGVEAALAAVKQNPPPTSLYLSEVGNNFLGTGLNIDPTRDDIETARQVFNLNASLFPTDPTVYQDLAALYEGLTSTNTLKAESITGPSPAGPPAPAPKAPAKQHQN